MTLPDNEHAASFDNPLELLAACHRRIETKCELLRKLTAYLPLHGCDDAARDAAAQIRKYFNTAGRHHHEDEEADLFPLVVAVDAKSAALVRRLHSEHRQMEAAWQTVDAGLRAIEQGVGEELAPMLIEEFVALYTRHIELEEHDLLPLARVRLGADQLGELGTRMAQRRGIKWPVR